MSEQSDRTQGPHQGETVLSAGEPLETARVVMILLHGRGGSAEGILSLAGELNHPGFTYLAPQAAGHSWYPLSFLAPIERNEPHLTSALTAVSGVLDRVARSGIPPERTILLGFSQGACLGLEFAARHARRYGAVVGLSGGLIGPDGTPRAYGGGLGGTPVFLGCSDIDPHIPKERVLESANVLRELGGEVTARLYPGMGHTVNQDELRFVKGLMAEIAAE